MGRAWRLWMAVLLGIAAVPAAAQRTTWTADNGDGTFTNPLFYDEFSDPDLIRVGEDYYLTGTTMHSQPGLPILHSRDLVNWKLLGYAFDRLDLGPDLRLEGGKEAYGQGIWAPSFRYHEGTFYIFSNVNGHTTQLFRATNPAGPWTRTPMKRSLHDLGVLFDDDGKVYVVWGYREVRMARLNDALDDLVPGTERVIIKAEQGMGEGAHLYKVDGRYYITSAWYSGRMRMPVARADTPYGPYEVNHAVSLDEGWGSEPGYRHRGAPKPPFDITPPSKALGRNVLHQGGIVQTPQGEYWGFSMTDFNSLGRLTGLSPVTWKDGWPYFGLPGNLGRTPRTWVKPATGVVQKPFAPYARDDAFGGPALGRVWQWNHVPDDARWSLRERRGFLRLHTLAAADLWSARNTLTQRAIGPRSTPVAVLETAGMQDGDTAGLALFGLPWRTLGVVREGGRQFVEFRDQQGDKVERMPFAGKRIWLRAECDYLTEEARFAYSLDGKTYKPLGDPVRMVFQLKTFQGIRYGLFAYNRLGRPGGYADFDSFAVAEPKPKGLMHPIPLGKQATLTLQGSALMLAEQETSVIATEDNAVWFRIVDRGQGRVALAVGDSHVSIGATGDAWIKPGAAGEAETFQWMETVYGEPMLLSLATQRYLTVDPASGQVSATSPGARPDRKDHARWVVTERGGR
ncbi:glycoside hydrolase 43 family protein [Sphingomonas sp. HF-S4]|uniref:Glycoside hydrolase 43 family protein n=1 Tax=Sphingomonas agrestis TaxID=3080540 RepID=A0ABU3YCC7_9SPHN|nr:glycoside hydrolase 43 family protein [Sphingomonas sp. HF-S4]MDV3459055.1 glycoside hydrolase 43 family protein [Sphingomonas sp. HF-S4]